MSRTRRRVPGWVPKWAHLMQRIGRGLFPTKGMNYGTQSSARERGAFVMDGRTGSKPGLADRDAIIEQLDEE
jgi:hypothetical protein